MGKLKVGLDNISRPNIGFEGCKLGFEVNSVIQRQVFRTRILKKECFFTINSKVDKKMYPIPYTNNLPVWFKGFCFGTSYFLQYK